MLTLAHVAYASPGPVVPVCCNDYDSPCPYPRPHDRCQAPIRPYTPTQGPMIAVRVHWLTYIINAILVVFYDPKVPSPDPKPRPDHDESPGLAMMRALTRTPVRSQALSLTYT